MQFSLNTQSKIKVDHQVIYDTIVLGGGPAGLNASIYATRKGLKVLLIADKLGGQLENTKQVDNYLGFENVDSQVLISAFVSHAKSLNVTMLTQTRITKINKTDDIFMIRTSDGTTYQSKTVIYALGSFSRKLGLFGEDKLEGISYCAVCDAPFFKDKEVIVVGGGNSALESALDLTHYASSITIVQRSILRADQILIDKVTSHPQITIMLDTVVKSLNGENQIESIELFNTKTNQSFTKPVGGLFIEIGHIPNTTLLKDVVKLNDDSSISTDAYQKTATPGLFVAGDASDFHHKQIIIASAQGAVSALEASKYLLNKKEG